jgi:hypothetical protein
MLKPLSLLLFVSMQLSSVPWMSRVTSSHWVLLSLGVAAGWFFLQLAHRKWLQADF